MKSIIALGMTVFLSAETLAQASFELPADKAATAQGLVETALESDLAYEIVESLTTQVGPRLARKLKPGAGPGAKRSGASSASTVSASRNSPCPIGSAARWRSS